jgi:lysophospholipase L1-like esterase
MRNLLLLLLLSLLIPVMTFANNKPVNTHQTQKKLNILTIGDSNGALAYGWPTQIKNLLPDATIVNKSISGNTIGFDNNDQIKLNTLKNIDRYLEEAFKELGAGNKFDFVVMVLGTNDTKKVFENRQKEVPENMVLLIHKIKDYMTSHNMILPKICIITPPPMDEEKADKVKYGGGDGRIQKNNTEFKKVAKENNIDFLDTYSVLKKDFSEKTLDGVHLVEKAQLQVATEIVNYIKSK